MGKKKENLEALRRDDPKENNWEIAKPEPKPEIKYPEELSEVFAGIKDAALKQQLYNAWLKVDPDIRKGNPLWIYSAKSGSTVLIFRSGQKVRISDPAA